MMRRLVTGLVMLLIGGMCLYMLAGCVRSAPVHFYILTALPDASAPGALSTTSHPLSVGIGPVTLPEYLDRSEIVMQAGAHQLNLAEFAQWAEPLAVNLSRVIAENLSHLLRTDRVLVHPGSRSAPLDYQVVVDVTRFEGAIGGDSQLMARWAILDGEGKQEHVRRQSDIKVRPEGQAYEAIVAAMSVAASHLSRDIAVALQALAQPVSGR